MKTNVSSVLPLAAASLLACTFNLHSAEPAPAAPVPGSPGIYVDHAGVEKTLAVAVAARKDPATAPIVSTDQYLITAVRRFKPIAPPAIHPGWSEVHVILEGGGTFVTGGKIVTPDGAKVPVIEGGVLRKVVKGDTVIVPANSPHWYQQLDADFKAVEIRFIAPNLAQ
jgi:mannose-6-phosphate isomerase-like protein (cupin superfamily)